MDRRKNIIEEVEELRTQALIVTAGPFEGRICENDDSDFLARRDFSRYELNLYDKAGVPWGRLRYRSSQEDKRPFSFSREIGTHCEIVSFGFYLQCGATYGIPRAVLRRATMKDIVSRNTIIGTEICRFAFDVPGYEEREELISLLHEQYYIMDRVWAMEHLAKFPNATGRLVFLCHSTSDKYFVRQVRNDLADLGHVPWIDEFEIAVGDSIVEKISAATEVADALIIFLSESSVQSSWVTREWQSTLMRQLSGKKTRILPALIDDIELPPLISDIKYADFRVSYDDGLSQLMDALSRL